MGTLQPKTKGLNKFIVKVDVVSGVNTLSFKVQESGIIISNVDMVRYTLAENIIQNGKFT